MFSDKKKYNLCAEGHCLKRTEKEGLLLKVTLEIDQNYSLNSTINEKHKV